MEIVGFPFNQFKRFKSWFGVGLKSTNFKSHDFNLSVQLGGGEGFTLIKLLKLIKLIKLINLKCADYHLSTLIDLGLGFGWNLKLNKLIKWKSAHFNLTILMNLVNLIILINLIKIIF